MRKERVIEFITSIFSASLLINPVTGYEHSIDSDYYAAVLAMAASQAAAQTDEAAQSNETAQSDETSQSDETLRSNEMEQSDGTGQYDEIAELLAISSDRQESANSNSEGLVDENFIRDTNKIILNRQECIPRPGEIIVCADKDVDTRYRIENRRALTDLPRSHRSWVDGADRLTDNAERNRLGSFSASGYFGGRSQSIKNLRDHCEQGASQAREENTQARAIAEISQNQTSAPPKREQCPCEV